MNDYCPCEEEGDCDPPAPGADGEGEGAGAQICDPSMCPSREAIELARCTNPITIRITGQVLPK
jgi:hypothetical protein